MAKNSEIKTATRRAPHVSEGQQIAYTTTAANTALNAALPGNWVTVQNLSTAQYVRIQFGNADNAVVFGGTSGIMLGFELAPGQREDWWVPETSTHIAHDGDGNGNLQLWMAG
jgi:hypothetical protein